MEHVLQEGREAFFLPDAPAKGIGVAKTENLRMIRGLFAGAKTKRAGNDAIREFDIFESRVIVGNEGIEEVGVIVTEFWIELRDVPVIIVVVVPKGVQTSGRNVAGMIKQPFGDYFGHCQQAEKDQEASSLRRC